MQTQVLSTKKERGEFLENDFIDRLIRIEQRVSAKFGKLIKYDDTYCYKNLTPENRKKYDKYLKDKKKKKFVFATSMLFPLLGILFLSNGITGNAVKEGVGDVGFNFIYMFLFVFIAGFILSIGFSYLIKSKRNKRFDSLFRPLEAVASKKKDL